MCSSCFMTMSTLRFDDVGVVPGSTTYLTGDSKVMCATKNKAGDSLGTRLSNYILV